MSSPPMAPLEDPEATGSPVAGVGPPTLSPPPPDPPLVDVTVLHELERQVDGPTAVLDFVRDFSNLWGPRCGRLSEALRAVDDEAALDALLSVKSAASMVGAVGLVQIAEAIENALKWGDRENLAVLLPLLISCGSRTLEALQDRYVRPSETD